MNRQCVRLGAYNNDWYCPGRSIVWQSLWFFAGLPLLRSSLIPSARFRVVLLRMFGAKIGTGVVIKPGVRVKYPWRLRVGNDCWIGEDAWIDNIEDISLDHDVCVSQGAYLCTGNHDWSDPAFGLMLGRIELEAGSWVGARSTIGPGVVLQEGAVAGAGSVVSKSIPAYEVHSGNPAALVRMRVLRDAAATRQQEPAQIRLSVRTDQNHGVRDFARYAGNEAESIERATEN